MGSHPVDPHLAVPADRADKLGGMFAVERVYRLLGRFFDAPNLDFRAQELGQYRRHRSIDAIDDRALAAILALSKQPLRRAACPVEDAMRTALAFDAVQPNEPTVHNLRAGNVPRRRHDPQTQLSVRIGRVQIVRRGYAPA
jgi:hypothetical protein